MAVEREGLTRYPMRPRFGKFMNMSYDRLGKERVRLTTTNVSQEDAAYSFRTEDRSSVHRHTGATRVKRNIKAQTTKQSRRLQQECSRKAGFND